MLNIPPNLMIDITFEMKNQIFSYYSQKHLYLYLILTTFNMFAGYELLSLKIFYKLKASPSGQSKILKPHPELWKSS